MSEQTLSTIADYREAAARVRARVQGLTDAQLSYKPSPEQWSVKEVAAHLVDSSLVHAIRIRKIVAEPQPAFVLYDQDAWVTTAKSNTETIDAILLAYEAIVAYNALFFTRLTEADWHKTGSNAGQKVSLADLFQGFIRHTEIHLAQIDRTRAALPSDV